MKRIFQNLFYVSTLAFALACNKKNPVQPNNGTKSSATNVSGRITKSTTWAKDSIYTLDGRVIVTAGNTLTIQAGTIIKAKTGTGTNASALIIARGAKMIAKGTAAEPIIFTSELDQIKKGGKYVGNLKKTDNQKWGGLIILGKAQVSAKAGTEAGIEGLPGNETYGKYGATSSSAFVNDDNSGVLEYVSIRHGGVTIGEGNEINGLTLGGVGTGTKIENIEVFATLDDGVELFGGTVNLKNVMVYWPGDDGIDIDQNYSGTVDNFLVYQGAGVSTDEGLEIDGPEGSLKDGKFTLKNGTLVSDGAQEASAADLKSDAQGTIQNVVLRSYATGKGVFKVEGEYKKDNCQAISTHLASYQGALSQLLRGNLSITESKANGIQVYSKKDQGKSICPDQVVTDQKVALTKFTNTPSATGATATNALFGWTAAVQSKGVTLP